MEVDRIVDGLWRWTAFHEEWRHDVGCVYCESDEAVCLIDPLVPPEARDRFVAALDRQIDQRPQAGAQLRVPDALRKPGLGAEAQPAAVCSQDHVARHERRVAPQEEERVVALRGRDRLDSARKRVAGPEGMHPARPPFDRRTDA